MQCDVEKNAAAIRAGCDSKIKVAIRRILGGAKNICSDSNSRCHAPEGVAKVIWWAVPTLQ